MKITAKIYRAISATNKRLLSTRRWSSTQTDNQYDELAKQAFNALITYILASYEENKGRKINWDNFPLISMYRSFQKAWLNSDISEKTFAEICRIGKLGERRNDSVTKEIIHEMLGDEFGGMVCEAWESPEKRIFQAASKIATYIEGNMLSLIGPEKVHELLNDVQEYYDIPSVMEIVDPNSNIFKLLKDIANLRHQNRWVTFFRGLDCSVLGHLLDTAYYAYLMGLEKYPKSATKLFFLGIFHDVPEGWTKDIPSPVKDKIPGFRDASEKFELNMVEEHIYNVVPDFLGKKIKAVMMEGKGNKRYKKIMKGADYLSASVECLWNLVAGSRDGKFIKAMEDLNNKSVKIDGKDKIAHITPQARKFYNEVLAEGERMKLILSNFFEP